MTRTHLIRLLAATMLVAFGVASAVEATINLNSSKSNIYKTAPDCAKAGGSWAKGRDGLGCYMPEKPAAGNKTTPK